MFIKGIRTSHFSYKALMCFNRCSLDQCLKLFHRQHQFAANFHLSYYCQSVRKSAPHSIDLAPLHAVVGQHFNVRSRTLVSLAARALGLDIEHCGGTQDALLARGFILIRNSVFCQVQLIASDWFHCIGSGQRLLEDRCLDRIPICGELSGIFRCSSRLLVPQRKARRSAKVSSAWSITRSEDNRITRGGEPSFSQLDTLRNGA